MRLFNASNILISLFFLVGTFETINASAPAQQNMDEIPAPQPIAFAYSLIANAKQPHLTLNFSQENGPLLPNVVRGVEITIDGKKLDYPLGASQITVTMINRRHLKHDTAAKRCDNVCDCCYGSMPDRQDQHLECLLCCPFQLPCTIGYVCCNNKIAKKGFFCCYNNDPRFRDDYEENQ